MFRTSPKVDAAAVIAAAVSQARAELRDEVALTEQAERDRNAAYLEYRAAILEKMRPVVAQFIQENRPDIFYDAAVDSVCAYLMNHNQSATLENISAAIVEAELKPKELSEVEERAQIESQIAAILADVKIPENWSAHDQRVKRESIQARIDHNHQRFSNVFDDATAQSVGRKYVVSTADMRTELDNLKRSRMLRGLSHGELKAHVKAQTRPHTYEALPANFTPVNISEMSPATLQEMIRRYGQDQIDQRLREQQEAGSWKGIPVVSSRQDKE